VFFASMLAGLDAPGAWHMQDIEDS
jgi:hypothetical protein